MQRSSVIMAGLFLIAAAGATVLAILQMQRASRLEHDNAALQSRLAIMDAQLLKMRQSAACEKTNVPAPTPDPATEQNEKPTETEGSRDAALLERLTSHESAPVRLEAVELLHVLAPQHAAKLCAGLLERESDPSVVLVLLHVAGKERVGNAYPFVHKHLLSSTAAIQAKAAWTIGEMVPVLTTEQIDESRVTMEKILQSKTQQSPAKPEQGTDPGVLLACVDALGQMKKPASAKVLVGLLTSKEPVIVRRAAVRCLPDMATPELSQALQKAWQDEREPSIRSAIEIMLAKEPFRLTVDKKGVFVPRPTVNPNQN